MIKTPRQNKRAPFRRHAGARSRPLWAALLSGAALMALQTSAGSGQVSGYGLTAAANAPIRPVIRAATDSDAREMEAPSSTLNTHAKIAQSIAYPVKVMTVPSEAEVWVNKRRYCKSSGRKGCTFVLKASSGPFIIEARLEGYDTRRFVLHSRYLPEFPQIGLFLEETPEPMPTPTVSS